MRFKTLVLAKLAMLATINTICGADLPTNAQRMNVDSDRECSGRIVFDPKRKDHVRQDIVVCKATGPAYDVDTRVCRIEGAQDICLQDGKGDFFYVWNVHRDPANKSRHKVTAQSSTNQKSDATFALYYRILFHPDPCSASSIGDRISCLAGKVGQMNDTLDRLPGQIVSKPTPGYGCSDPAWCLLVMPDGSLFLGNPSGVGGPPLEPFAQNVLRNLADKEQRSFEIQCYANFPSLGRYCTGTDAKGNVYAGAIDSASPDRLFDLRRPAQ